MYRDLGDIYRDLKKHYGKIFPYTEEEFIELVRGMLDDKAEQAKSRCKKSPPDEHDDGDKK